MIEVPADAPIPSRETIYVWDAVEGCWVTWVQWVFAEAHRNAVVEQARAPRQAALFRGQRTG